MRSISGLLTGPEFRVRGLPEKGRHACSREPDESSLVLSPRRDSRHFEQGNGMDGLAFCNSQVESGWGGARLEKSARVEGVSRKIRGGVRAAELQKGRDSISEGACGELLIKGA